MVRCIRSICPFVHGWFGWMKRCSIAWTWQVRWKGWPRKRAVATLLTSPIPTESITHERSFVTDGFTLEARSFRRADGFAGS
jgi:hypothetical protein